ncbi:F-box/kelch-repeat protein SKIP4 [Macadamia integrifolia]|uniref:F-box/kelch-repeat protein SKIP4 n=1 Tax=Macadamia integrifolia TaxID=60698 RepID=UPI001C4FB27F|nr:F-box/kelch-repeat protein SKIP4 [Macadamia integrifolia]
MMEHPEHEPECSTDMTQNNAPLICGLPDDIALFCLARVPRRYHMTLKCVSKRWRELVCSEEWYYYRQKHNLEETWIYALCRDKSDQIHCYVMDPNSSREGWKLIQGLPPRCSKRKGMASEVLGKKFYLLGGCSWSEDATHDVYCYDASKNTWDEAASMSTARCYFACEALNGKFYAIGGVTSSSSDQCSWDTYDPSTTSGMTHMDPNIFSDIQESVVLHGKIYIRGAVSTIFQHIPALVYEPTSSTWQHVDEDLVSGWHGPAVVVDDTLYVLDQSSGTRLMMWLPKSRDWVSVGRLSPLLTRPPCRLVAIGKSIFVIGKGLSTVMLDLAKAGNVGGVMVSSSFPKLDSDDDVISCKALSV